MTITTTSTNTAPLPAPRAGDAAPPRRAVPVIWTACLTGSWEDSDYLHRVIDRAAKEGAIGVELCGRYIDTVIRYRDYPVLAATRDPESEQRLERLTKICRHAHDRGLRVGVWHHEVGWPADRPSLLDLIPDLRAADGLINLDSPELYRLITSRVGEFLDLIPQVSEMVLTLTETAYPVMHRPYCAIPPAERIRRVLQAVADATEPRQRGLVIRPFSALRVDEQNVARAVAELRGQHVSLMHKTDPADWHPFLPDEEAIGSVPQWPCRAETDAGAEYYGQNEFPCSHTAHLTRRMDSALRRGATTAVLRVDRGWSRNALDHPFNEANLIVTHRWLRDPNRSLEETYQDWLQERHHVRSPELHALLEKTFEVISRTFYADGHCLTHNRFPSLTHAKHVQAFSLFEPDVPLDHLRENWGVLWQRRSPTHEKLLREKDEALALATDLRRRLQSLNVALPDDSRRSLEVGLDRLALLARSMRQWCRVVLAHLSQMWRLPGELTGSFDAEAGVLLDLAAQVRRDCGESFFGTLKAGDDIRSMPRDMEELVTGLRREREWEMHRRQALQGDPRVLDFVLAGLCSEGHRLRKRVHSGSTPWITNHGPVRATGLGIDEGFGYQLISDRRGPAILQMDFSGNNAPVQGIVRIGTDEHPLRLDGPGPTALTLPVQWPGGALPVEFWSTSDQPVAVMQIVLRSES